MNIRQGHNGGVARATGAENVKLRAVQEAISNERQQDGHSAWSGDRPDCELGALRSN